MTLDPAIAKALSHPLRVRILERLEEEDASPASLSRQMDDVALGLIAYHVKVLEESGFLELIETRPRRGAVEHIYRAKPIGGLELRGVPRSLRGSISATTLQRFIDASVAALQEGTIDRRDDAVLNTMTIGVDEIGWREAVELGRRMWAEFHRIHAESHERAAASGGDFAALMSVVVGIAGFEAANSRRPTAQ